MIPFLWVNKFFQANFLLLNKLKNQSVCLPKVGDHPELLMLQGVGFPPCCCNNLMLQQRAAATTCNNELQRKWAATTSSIVSKYEIARLIDICFLLQRWKLALENKQGGDSGVGGGGGGGGGGGCGVCSGVDNSIFVSLFQFSPPFSVTV